MNVAEQIGEICHIEGLRFIAGVMGGSATHIVRALDAIPGRTALYCRQERVAVDACDGFARVTGDPGIVFTDAGPGAANAMVGILNSWGDSVPVLFFAPIQDRFEVFAQRFTKELPVVDVYGPVSQWTAKLVDPGQVDMVMRNAFLQLRAARSGPVVIGIPRDLARLEGRPTTHKAVPRHRAAADPRDVERALALIAAAERPYLYVGAGARSSGASAELRELAELLTLPVATTLNAKGVFPETHPLSLGIGGFPRATYSTLQAEKFAAEADLIIAIGCGFKRDAVKGPTPTAKLVQIDADPGALDHLYPADVSVLGDAKTVLAQLLDCARSLPKERLTERAGVKQRIKTLKDEWWTLTRPMLTSTATPIDPFRVTWELSQLVDHEKAIVTHDAGGTRGYICQHWETTSPTGFLGYGVQSAMGWAIGAAMGAKAAAPDKTVICYVGDEAFCEVGMDIETSVVCGTPILVVLLNNRADSLAQLKTMKGGRGFNPTLGTVRWGGNGRLGDVAKALGAETERVEDPEAIKPALQRALRTVSGGRTAVVEVITARTPHILGHLLGHEGGSGE